VKPGKIHAFELALSIIQVLHDVCSALANCGKTLIEGKASVRKRLIKKFVYTLNKTLFCKNVQKVNRDGKVIVEQ
jgi:hypothetical protein